jgi:hypothetical protein
MNYFDQEISMILKGSYYVLSWDIDEIFKRCYCVLINCGMEEETLNARP